MKARTNSPTLYKVYEQTQIYRGEHTMSDDVWQADDEPVNAIEVGNTQVTVEGEIEGGRVQEVARDNGVKKFKVKDENGNTLSQSDFPYNGNVKVSEYNENA